MKEQPKKSLIRLLLPLGASSVLLVVLLCGLSRSIESEAQAPFAIPSQEADYLGIIDYQTGVSVCQQTQNLVPNPGFEQGDGMPDHWYEVGPCAFSYPRFDGDVAAQIVGVSPRDTDCRLFTSVEEIPVEGGRYYDYSAWVKATLPEGEAYLRITFWRWREDPPGWEYLGDAYTNPVTDTPGAWALLTGSAQAPATAEYARVEVTLPASSEGSVWFDDIFLGLATCLEITKSAGPPTATLGELLTYTIAYSNTGREKATNVQIIETYDPCVDLEWVQPPPLVGTTNIWPIPELPPGASGTITVVVRVADDVGEQTGLFNCVQILSDETVKPIYVCIWTPIVQDGCALGFYVPVADKPGELGHWVDYDLLLCNGGSCDGWVDLAAGSSQGYEVLIMPTLPYFLPSDSCKNFTLSVSVPQDALGGTVGVMVLTATLACEPPCAETVTATAMVTTTVTAIPLTGVAIYGPKSGYVNTSYAFTARITPTTATLPISFTWSPQPSQGQGSAVVTYAWSIIGTYTIAITATNAGGMADDIHRFMVAWYQVYLPLILRR